MEKYLLLLLFIDSFIRVVFKVKPFGLSCGLFGFNGAKAPDLNKIKILGLYNQSRGEHSCGMWFNNELVKGVDKMKLFTDFIADHIMKGTKDSKTFIGHTRRATTGSHTLENAHPFDIENRMVLAHNGTIPNIWILCGENDVNHAKIHVDSLALGILIDKVGFKILNQYKGAAALLFQFKDDPDSLYVYHGASREKKGGTEFEERPLYYLKTKEGIYFSSMEASLKAIRTNDKEVPEILPHNIVYRITNGVFTDDKFIVERGDCNIEAPKAATYVHNSSYKQITNGSSTTTNNSTGYTYNRKEPDTDKNVEPIIFLETKPKNATNKDSVFFYQGRYWENRTEAAEDRLCHGLRYINKAGYIVQVGNKHAVPYFFYKGVMLKNMTDFNELIKLTGENSPNLDTKYNFAMFISKHSRYPICNLKDEASAVNLTWRRCWFAEGNPADTTFTPKFAKRNYHITRGVLTKISTSDKKETPLTKKPETGPITAIGTHIKADGTEESVVRINGKIIPISDSAQILAEVEAIKTQKNITQELFPLDNNCGDSCLIPLDKNVKIVTNKASDSVVTVEQNKTGFNDLYSIQVQSVAKQLRKVYESMEDLYAEVGATAIEAMANYVKHYYQEIENGQLDKDYLTNEVMILFKSSVDEGITIEETLLSEKWCLKVEDYIQQAIDDEVNEIVSEIDDESVIDSTAADIQQKYQDDEEAVSMLDGVISHIVELYERADDMQTLTGSDLAQDVAYEIYKSIGGLKSKLKEILLEKQLFDQVRELTKIEKASI